jgi:hypothetical protein
MSRLIAEIDTPQRSIANVGFWREAVIRDTWMSAKCHSRRFYDVLVTSAFLLIPMLVKTVSRSEGVLD